MSSFSTPRWAPPVNRHCFVSSLIRPVSRIHNCTTLKILMPLDLISPLHVLHLPTANALSSTALLSTPAQLPQINPQDVASALRMAFPWLDSDDPLEERVEQQAVIHTQTDLGHDKHKEDLAHATFSRYSGTCTRWETTAMRAKLDLNGPIDARSNVISHPHPRGGQLSAYATFPMTKASAMIGQH
jgi:hypothetical protein